MIKKMLFLQKTTSHKEGEKEWVN